MAHELFTPWFDIKVRPIPIHPKECFVLEFDTETEIHQGYLSEKFGSDYAEVRMPGTAIVGLIPLSECTRWRCVPKHNDEADWTVEDD
jgi:hypothetical protein